MKLHLHHILFVALGDYNIFEQFFSQSETRVLKFLTSNKRNQFKTTSGGHKKTAADFDSTNYGCQQLLSSESVNCVCRHTWHKQKKRALRLAHVLSRSSQAGWQVFYSLCYFNGFYRFSVLFCILQHGSLVLTSKSTFVN